jgi:hypothetical protein
MPLRLILGALLSLLAMHATYWLVIHPVNNFWLKDTNVDRALNSFFSFIPSDVPLAKKRIGKNCAVAGNTRMSHGQAWVSRDFC